MECSICYENIKDKRTLKCDHSFCKRCISKWIEKSNSCPCCRTKIVVKCHMCRNGCSQCMIGKINIYELFNELDEYFHNKNQTAINETLHLIDLCRSIGC